jgi:hypothetical protein
MVFGRKGLGGGDSGVEAQRQHLARTETALVNVEQGIARLPGYKAQFADAWFDSPEVAEAIERVRQAREILDQIKAQVAAASQASPVIEQHLGTIDELVALRLIVLDSFAAVLIGRQHIWNGGAHAPGSPFNPTVREAQQALHADASRLAHAVQEHIDELRPLREQHQAYWPPNLNLEHLQAYLDDGRKALDTYSDQFAAHDQPLPPQASIELLVLAQRMEGGVEMIETERQNLAVTIVTRNALKNSART